MSDAAETKIWKQYSEKHAVFTLAFGIFALSLLGLTASQTTRGLGEDIEDLGEEMQQESAEHQHY